MSGEAVAALHRQSDDAGHAVCVGCLLDFPCPTLLAHATEIGRLVAEADTLMRAVDAFSVNQTGTADHGMLMAAGRVRVVLNEYRHDCHIDPGGCRTNPQPPCPEPTSATPARWDIATFEATP